MQEASAPQLSSGVFSDAPGIASVREHFLGERAESAVPAGPLAFGVSPDGKPVAVPGCTIVGQTQSARIYRDPARLRPAQAHEDALDPPRTRHGVVADPDASTEALQMRRLWWPLDQPVLRAGTCEGVTHATGAVELGMQMDPTAGDECGDLERLEHPADAFETNCPMDVIAFELVPVTLAPAGAESARITEPMIRIEGGQFGKDAVETFWMDRDEVGHEAFARCARAGVCANGEEPRPVSPFPNGPAGASTQDAATYCNWVEKRLPTLQEWQWAARGREEARVHPWGDEAPDFTRVAAVDSMHERHADRRAFESGDPRIMEVRSKGAWVGLWQRMADDRGIRPLGTSRDGVRDLIGNMAETVLSRAGEGAGFLNAGGSFRSYLPDHSEIALTGNKKADKRIRDLREHALAALTVEGTTTSGFEMLGGYGRLGIRCVADSPPQGAELEPEVQRVGARMIYRPLGLRRFAEAAALCSQAELLGKTWTLPSRSELEAVAAGAASSAVEVWTDAGRLWRDGRRRPGSERSTAYVVCVDE